MSDPTEAVQRALWETLTGDAALTAHFGETPRIWDRVPRDANGQAEGGYPYGTFGDFQAIGFEATEQVDEAELFADLDFWSKPEDGSGREWNLTAARLAVAAIVEPGAFEAFAARVAAHGFNCVLGERRDARHLDPVDGVEHVRLTFRFELDPQPD
jgi:hypothetical protein